MPRLRGATEQVERQGGIAKYRTIKRDGRYARIAITRRAGPRGGRTVRLDEFKKPKGGK